MKPSVCPLCEGAGSLPAKQEVRQIGNAAPRRCHSCDGKGIVWPPVPFPAASPEEWFEFAKREGIEAHQSPFCEKRPYEVPTIVVNDAT